MKMKKVTRILSFLLVACTLVSVAGCKNEEFSKVEWNKGTHNFTAPLLDYDLVKNGSTEYTLVYPADGLNEQIRTAKDEFVYFFEEATGVTIPVMPDNNLEHSETNKYISIGNTTLLKTSGIEVDTKALTFEGVRIVTEDQTVFLTGGSDYGTIYAVYDFMDILFDYHYYGNNVYEIQKNVKDVKLRDFNVTNIPDFEFRAQAMQFDDFYRLRMPYTYGSLQISIFEKWKDRENLVVDNTSAKKNVHNSLYVLPKSIYVSEHPGWYSDGGDQLCYTAHGDDEELKIMAQESAAKIKASFKEYPTVDYPLKNVATLTMEDNASNCGCEACIASENKYGTASAAVLRFMNLVNEDVQAWMAEQKGQPWYRETIYILFFAYMGFVDAPAHYDSDKGKYVANDPSLYCSDGLAVWMAPINGNYRVDFYSEANDEFRENTAKWGALSKNIFLWTYETNFSGYLWMHDTFSFFTPDAYKYLRAHGGTHWFSQKQRQQNNSSTAFHNLKRYLESELSWNCNQDYEELINNYFNAVYKEAAPIMKNLWWEERLYMQYLSKFDSTLNEGTYVILTNKKYWKYQTIKNWMDICDNALEAVAKYKTSDPQTYEKIKFLVESEWVSPAYTMLEYHASDLSNVELTALKSRFKEVIYRTEITQIRETGGLLYDYVANF